jgi:hypothetical protein
VKLEIATNLNKGWNTTLMTMSLTDDGGVSVSNKNGSPNSMALWIVGNPFAGVL